jgi:small ligand-binding sensory domain FIST
MPFAAALSEHPMTTQATGEVIGSVLEALGEQPDLVVLFVTAPHAGAIEDVASAIRTILRPGCLLGATAVSVLGGDHEVEEEPAIVLWAARLGSPVTPVRLEVRQTPDGSFLDGLPSGDDLAAGGVRRTLVLLPDPFTFPADAFLERVALDHPNLAVIGGLASAARGPGGNRLVLDGAVHTTGAVGALLGAGAPVSTVVSQGCRPIGDPMVVTRSERNVVYELAGRPALERLAELVAGLSPDDRALAQQGIHFGRVINEQQVEFERGDFLIRNVLGGDRSAGAIAVGDEVEVGSTVQFQVRDADSADDDLRELLAGCRSTAALVFTCNGRGRHLFGRPDHDAELVHEAVDRGATAGMFCAGELGPVGGRSFLHGFTASVLLFDEGAG